MNLRHIDPRSVEWMDTIEAMTEREIVDDEVENSSSGEAEVASASPRSRLGGAPLGSLHHSGPISLNGRPMNQG